MASIAAWVHPKYVRDIAKYSLQYSKAQPTPHILLEDFFLPSKFKQLDRALRKQRFERKEADLFSFLQSDNLFTVKDPMIREFLLFLTSREFHVFMAKLTGVKIAAGKVDASGFIYEPCDYLLCHDDELSSRRIAYVINFSTMTKQTGGALVFFNADKMNAPTNVAKRIYPKANSISLFTVTKRSHHMVEEVLKAERVSMTGWFHA